MIAKRITTLMLVFSLVLSLFTFSPILPAYAEDNSKIEILTSLGIYSEEDAMIYEEETLTREEVASILSVFFGVTERSYSVTTEFYDVPEYWASGHITTMVDNGIMGGYSDGLFRPKNNITVDEVIKIMITLTGYEPYAVYAGGYPNGYYNTALKYDFLDGVKISDRKAPVTKKVFTDLLYNAIHMPLLTLGQVNSINEVTYTTNKDVTLLTEKLDIYKVEGVFNATPYTTLDYSEAPGEDTIKIDNKLYKCYFDINPYLATNVEGYYRQSLNDTIGEVVYLAINERKTDIVTVESADIKSVTASKLTYADGKKTKSVDIPADVMVIYNGKRMADFDLSHINPAQGFVRLIYAENTNQLKTIIVQNEVNYLIDVVKFENNVLKITDKNNKRPINIDLNKDNVKLNVYNRGQAIEIRDIKPGMLISVMADQIDFANNSVMEESTLYTINISTDKVSGQLTSYDKEELTIEIDSVSFGVEKELFEKLVLGQSYNFYINYRNIVSAIDDNNKFLYGILLKSAINNEDESIMTFDIFTEGSEKIRLTCKDKLRIDGNLAKGTDKILHELKSSSNTFIQTIDIERPQPEKWATWQLVRYVANGNVLVQLDTIKPNAFPSEDDLSFYTNMIATKPDWYSGLGSIGNKIAILGAIMFEVPADKSLEDSYLASTITSFTEQNADYYFFDAGIMNRPKVFFKVKENPLEVLNNNADLKKAMLFEEIKYMRNSDDELTPFMCGYQLSAANTYLQIEIEDEDLITEKGIVRGNFVKWQEDATGLIRTVEKSLSVQDGALTADSKRATVKKPSGEISLALHMSFGRVEAIDDTYIKMFFDGDSKDTDDINDTVNDYSGVARHTSLSGNVYLYDSESNTIEKAALEDIHTDQLYGEGNGDMVGCYYNNAKMVCVVIFR